MKKLFVLVLTLALGASLALAFAQDTGDNGKGAHKTTSQKADKTSKAHKGGKKDQKGSDTSTTTPKTSN